MNKDRIRHPIQHYKAWRRARQRVVNSKVNLYASRKHRLPLEQCTKEQLEAAINHNQREARRYDKILERKPDKGNYRALATWHRLCQTPINELIAELKTDDMKVEDIKWKRRRKQTEELMRIRQLG